MKALLGLALVTGISVAQAATIDLNCQVVAGKVVGRGNVPGRPPAELATVQLSRIPARGALNLQTRQITLQQANGVILYSGDVNVTAWNANTMTFQAPYTRGAFVGSFLLGVKQGRTVAITLTPLPQVFAAFNVDCSAS